MHTASTLPRTSRHLRCVAVFAFLLLLAIQAAYAGSDAPVPPRKISTRPFAHFAVGVTVGTLGPGVEVVTTMSRRTNLRLDGHFLNYSHTFSQDGISYNARVRLRDYRASYDYYPFAGGFRVSAGVEAYNQFNGNAAVTIPVGQSITFNDVDYYSSAADPLHGSASVAYPNKVAPTLTLGWGNAIPRSGRRWGFPFEIGAAFTGAPSFNLAMAGSACTSPNDPLSCAPVNSDVNFQTDLAAERKKIVNDIKPFRVYPILSMGVTYRF
jgi:hypothetical protein